MNDEYPDRDQWLDHNDAFPYRPGFFARRAPGICLTILIIVLLAIAFAALVGCAAEPKVAITPATTNVGKTVQKFELHVGARPCPAPAPSVSSAPSPPSALPVVRVPNPLPTSPPPVK